MNQQSAMPPLRQRVIKALGWSVGGQIISYPLRIFSTLILTRLLAPESYGLLAIVTSVDVIVGLMADFGLRQSVISSKRGDDTRFLETAFTVQVIRAAIVTAVIILVAIAIAGLNRVGVFGDRSTFSHPLLPWLLGVSAFSSLILGFQSMKLFQIDRHLKAELTVKIELTVQLTTTLVTILAAVMTRSVWAMVIGGLIGNGSRVLLSRFWLPGHRDRFGWERGAARELLSFGRWIVLSSALTGLVMNGDRLLLGGFTSAENLGLYSLALNFVGMATGIGSRISSTVSLGAISQIARSAPERLPAVFGKIRIVTDTAMILSGGFMFVIAQPLIDLLYDHRYANAGALLQVLSFSLLFARLSLAQQVYVAIGRPQFLVIVSSAAAVALYVFVPIGLYFGGFHGAVIAIALREALIIPVLWALNARCGLNNFKHELFVLVAWPVGYAAGWIVVHIGMTLKMMLA